MEMAEIKIKIQANKYEISLHGEKERYAEDITIKDLERAILNGEILENYPDDQRGRSCLVLGYSNNRPIHVVCGYSKHQWIRILTVYLPQKPKWLNERTRAKRS